MVRPSPSQRGSLPPERASQDELAHPLTDVPLKVLFVGSEVAPFRKTGGLADVIGALPKALRICERRRRHLCRLTTARGEQ